MDRIRACEWLLASEERSSRGLDNEHDSDQDKDNVRRNTGGRQVYGPWTNQTTVTCI
jgi:hypothetical protein